MLVGIDFGTTKSVVAAFINGKPTVIADEDGRRYMPSVVAVGPDQALHVGWDAVNMPPFERWSSRFFTINSVKRTLGQQGETKWGAYQAYPQEIAALILSRLRMHAEARMGDKITGVVLATPAYFNVNEQWALREAAEIAGLPVLRTIHEPTAAALAYGTHQKTDATVAVFDFGGGTFDVSILNIGDGVYEVMAARGDTHLGGVDLTQALVDHLCGEFKNREGVDLRTHGQALSRVTEAAEQAKCQLSSQDEVSIDLPFLVPEQNPRHFKYALSRKQFEELAAPTLERVAACCREVIGDAGLTTGRIDRVVMVGASTRIPRVVSIAREVFQKDPLRSLDPTETVALGAALQAAAIGGELTDTILLDVIPLSLGVATTGGVMTRIVERNTTIPTKKSEIFSTADDGQEEVTIRVVQGDRPMAADGVFVGNVTLRGIPPAPKGVPQIEVTFDVDNKGALRVAAKDLGTGKQVQADLDRPSWSLNVAQKKVLTRKVASELRDATARIDAKHDVLRDDTSRERASSFAEAVLGVVTRLGDCSHTSTTARLREGERLIHDYLDRRASADDLDALVLRIRPIYEQAVVECCLASEQVVGAEAENLARAALFEGHTDGEVQRLIRALGRAPSARTVEAFIDVVGRAQGAVRQTALDALRRRDWHVQAILLDALQPSGAQGRQLGALVTARELGIQLNAPQLMSLWDRRLSEQVKLLLMDLIVRAAGSPPFEWVMTCADDPSDAVREQAWRYLDGWKSRMDAPAMRLFSIMARLRKQPGRLSVLDRWFLHRIAGSRPAWKPLVDCLCKGDRPGGRSQNHGKHA